MIDYFDMVSALTRDYLNVFFIEPESDTAQTVRLDGYVTDGIDEAPEQFGYTDMLKTYAKNRVCDEDRGYFIKLLTPEKLMHYFGSDVDHLEFIYRVLQDGKIHYYTAEYSRVRKKNAHPNGSLQLVAGFRNVDVLIAVMKDIGEQFPESLLRYAGEMR